MNRIRELRKARGWLQSDLAAQLHTTQQSIARYENGERGLDLDTIFSLCDIFGCTADYLLGRSQVRSFELSDDEAALLTGFRALSDPGKEYVRHSLSLAALAHGEKNGAVSELETAES